MGSFYTNLHVKSPDPNQVVEAIQSCQIMPAFVTDSVGGWVSVYARATESQDDGVLKSFANALSGSLKTGVFGFLVHDSDVFMYTLSENGQSLDNFCSDPGYFDGEDLAPEGGNLDAVLKYCVAGTSADKLKKVIKHKPNKAIAVAKVGVAMLRKDVAGMMNSGMIFAGDSAAQAMAQVLGIQEDRACLGYKYIKQRDTGTDTSSFVLIKDETAGEDLPMFRPVAGAPRLLKRQERDMERWSSDARAHVHEMGEAMGHHHSYSHSHSHAQDNSGRVGGTIRIVEELANAGGTTTGATIVVSGSSVEQGLIVPRIDLTVSAHGCGTSEYDEPEPTDQRFWPYDFKFVQSAPGVWMAKCDEFPLVSDFDLAILLGCLQSGRGTLNIEVKPNDENGGIGLTLNYTIRVLEASSAAEIEAHEVYFSGFSLMVPAGYESADSAFGLRCHREDCPFTELTVSVVNPDGIANNPLASFLQEAIKERTVSSIAELLEERRVSLKCREWQTSQLEPVVLDGITFERAGWFSQSKGISGIAMLGHDNKIQIVISLQSEEKSSFDALISASTTFKRSQVPVGALSGSTASRQRAAVQADAAPPAKAPVSLKIVLFCVRIVLLMLAYQIVFPQIPGVKTGDSIAVFALFFAIVWPSLVRIAMFIVVIAVPALRWKAMSLQANQGNRKNLFWQLPLGFVILLFGLYLYCLINPQSIQCADSTAFFTVVGIVFGINTIKALLDYYLVKRPYSGETRARLSWSDASRINCFEAAIRLNCGQSVRDVASLLGLPESDVKQIAAICQAESGTTETEIHTDLGLSYQDLSRLQNHYKAVRAEALWKKYKGPLSAKDKAFLSKWTAANSSPLASLRAAQKAARGEYDAFESFENWLSSTLMSEQRKIMADMKAKGEGSLSLIEEAERRLDHTESVLNNLENM